MIEKRPEIALALRPIPLGWIGLAAGEGKLLRIVSSPDRQEVRRQILGIWPDAVEAEASPMPEAFRQLEEYFSGKLRTFSLPLDFEGLPPFTAKILHRLAELPFGERTTYGELAALAGRPGAARAVGRVMALNPFPIVIPCHRVLGAGGKLTGYSGGEGVATKEWLLEFEGKSERPGAPP